MTRICMLSLLLVLAACGGGGGGEGGGGGSAASSGCSGGCALATPTALTVTEVERVVRQAVHEAQTRGIAATIAVVDRVGNVVAVFRMTGAAPTFLISSGRGVNGGLEGVTTLPAELAAISKAITGAYLSSEGNAFSTRTAGQIIQENFNPGEFGSPGGPLFGVQFSSLSCSDIVRMSPTVTAGPKGSPLGLAADPGGLPLYKGGTVVGGVGVIADGLYGLDLNINDIDADLDELIAVAGARGFDAPTDRRGDRITVDGRTLRYLDSETIVSNPAVAPAFAALPGMLVNVPGYFSPPLVSAGVPFATAASGYRPATNPAFTGLNAFVLDDGLGNARFAPMAGSDGLMTEAEVTAILVEAMKVANRARGQIRRPLGSAAQVSISVVDTNGVVLGLLRSPDAPVFGTDVAVQKARTALLFSHPATAADLAALPPANYLVPASVSPIGTYVTNLQALIPTALADGFAYSNRSVGNLARPFLPDGINGSGPGPLSKPYPAWSPFTNGLALDLVINQVVANLPVPGAGDCVGLPRARNGIQIFPGSVPVFRGATLIGAIGVSGDGIDQDDMIAFLGLANAGTGLGTGIGNAPPAQRADTIGGLPGGFLRYVNCPVAPFLDSTASNVCAGI